MTEQELLKFISRIIACGDETSISYALRELKDILEREGVEQALLDKIEDAARASREMADLGKDKRGADILPDELGKAIRDGRERIRRMEAMRC